MYIGAPCVFLVPSEAKKRVSGSLEQKLQEVVSHEQGAENRLLASVRAVMFLLLSHIIHISSPKFINLI